MPRPASPAVARRLIQPRLVTDLLSPPQCPDAFVELITKPVDTGWGRSERFRAPTPLPFPLPACWKRVLPMVTDVRERELTCWRPTPGAADAALPCPGLQFFGSFRAENG